MRGYKLKYKGPEIDQLLDKAGTAIQEHQDISHLAESKDVEDALKEIRELMDNHTTIEWLDVK